MPLFFIAFIFLAEFLAFKATPIFLLFAIPTALLFAVIGLGYGIAWIGRRLYRFANRSERQHP